MVVVVVKRKTKERIRTRGYKKLQEVTRSYKKLRVLPTRILVTYLHDRRVEGGGVEQTTDPGAHRGLHRGRPIRQLLVPGGMEEE